MKLKKVHSAVIASALTASMVITPVFADPTQQELEEQKANAQSELESFQTELDTLLQKANDLEIELINTGQEITQAEKDLEAAEEKKEEQYEAMKLRIKFMYESGTGSATMEKVMGAGNISDVLTQAEYSEKVHEYDREQLQEYADTVTEIENLQAALKEEMADLQETEEEYRTQQEALQETIASKQDEISDLDEMIQFLFCRRRPPVVFHVAHIDRGHLQFRRQAAQGQPAGHPFFPHITAECLFHCSAPPILVLFSENTLALVYTSLWPSARGESQGVLYRGHLLFFSVAGYSLGHFFGRGMERYFVSWAQQTGFLLL